MELQIILGLVIAISGSWGAMWYKIGKLTSEAKQHNRMLVEIQKAVEKLVTERRENHGN